MSHIYPSLLMYIFQILQGQSFHVDSAYLMLNVYVKRHNFHVRHYAHQKKLTSCFFFLGGGGLLEHLNSEYFENSVAQNCVFLCCVEM